MDVRSLFESFKSKNILVIGDVMIDAYLEGRVSRVSPEAPVPIVSFASKEERLGGAANVALNLLSLGANVAICSVIGKDEAGRNMLGLMNDKNIDTTALIQSLDRKTTIKTRVIGNNQQLLRVDNEQVDDINESLEAELLQTVEQALNKKCDAIIFEDYNKGVLTKKVIQKVIHLAQKHNVVTAVDPKDKNFLSYKGVTLFKPNLKELEMGLSQSVDPNNKIEFESAVQALNRQITAKIVFVTLSEYGVYIEDDKQKHYVPAHIRTIADVSGAGDTVISVATLCLISGLPIKNIATIANLAGGLVCEKVGVVAIDRDQLFNEVEKIYTKC